MKRSISNTIVLIAANALATWPAAVFAHDGHGLSGSHWHASDTWGFLAVGVLLALAIWLSRHGK